MYNDNEAQARRKNEMTWTINLTPEQDAMIEAAAQKAGVEPAEFVRKIVADHLPAVPPAQTDEDPTLALFKKWAEEDAKMTPEEVEAERKMWEEFERNINAERERAGMRKLYL
jgi:hypothetical protein